MPDEEVPLDGDGVGVEAGEELADAVESLLDAADESVVFPVGGFIFSE